MVLFKKFLAFRWVFVIRTISQMHFYKIKKNVDARQIDFELWAFVVIRLGVALR